MTTTVFGVALPIPQPHSDILTTWRSRVGDPAAEQILPHVTLLPPTPVASDAVDAVDAHLRAAASATGPFDMHLAGTGTFRPASPVVYIQIARGVAECEVLESAIRRGPLGRDLDFPYHPHVTVAQEIDEDALDEAYEGLSGFVARFPVTAFGLFRRAADGSWHQEKHYPLGA